MPEQNELFDRFKIYRRGFSVERMHTVPHIQPYNNGYHSANAALIALEIAIEAESMINLTDILEYMLKHDLAEQFTGDIPADVKRSDYDLKLALDTLEKDWEANNIGKLPYLSKHGKAICKAADYIELGMYCLDEIKLGNTNVYYVLGNIVAYLRELLKENNEILKCIVPTLNYLKEHQQG